MPMRARGRLGPSVRSALSSGVAPALLAGAAGAATATALMAVVHTFAPHVPFPPLTIAQAIVRAAPGGFATFFIDHLGHWALRVAVAGTAVAFLASGAVLGLAIRPLRARLPWWASGSVAFAPLWLGSVLLDQSRPGSVGRWPFALASLPVMAAGGAVAGRVAARLQVQRRAAMERDASGADAPVDPSRRYLLRTLYVGTLGVVLGVADLGRLLYRRPDPGRLLLSQPVSPPPTPPPGPGDAGFASIAGLTPQITPLASFYVVDEEIIDPDIDPSAWRLAVAGRVGTPLHLTIRDLEALPLVERYQTLECISNPIGGNLMSTALWTGVPLAEILTRATPAPESAEVVFTCAGGYTESLPFAIAMDPTTLVVIGMDGHVLPRAHGYPARILSVGTYGMKNPKWLERIDLVARPYEGYWEQRGWSKLASVQTFSRIDTPLQGEVVTGPVQVAGVAFAGARGISRVEVSADAGSTWSAADLRTPLSPYTWVQWRSTVPAGRGRTVLVVRATDGDGRLQARSVRPEHPSGATGYHAISIERR